MELENKEELVKQKVKVPENNDASKLSNLSL